MNIGYAPDSARTGERGVRRSANGYDSIMGFGAERFSRFFAYVT